MWAAAEGQSAHDSTTLAVAVEGVRGQQQAGGQGMTGGTVAPLGPDRQTAPDSGRTSRAWGPARAAIKVGVET